MDAISSNAAPLHVVIHLDEDTPEDFVLALLRDVFGHPEREAAALAAEMEASGAGVCGPYPASVAKALVEAARARIRLADHDLRVTAEEVTLRCELCGAIHAATELQLPGRTARICGACVIEVTRVSARLPAEEFAYACDALRWHFGNLPASQMMTTVREFPAHLRADLQVALNRLFAKPLRFFGIHESHRYDAVSMSRLMRGGHDALPIAPPELHDVDIGEGRPVKCLHNGLWLCQEGELRFAVLLSLNADYSRPPTIRLEIATPIGSAGAGAVQRALAELEEAVDAARSYRGKILSLDAEPDYRGRSRGVTVHRLPPVQRDELILPEATLHLLERNVLNFVGSRDALRRLGQSTRKGILLYGPPGTGKTHTIRYLATNLPGHTTLIITAEQVVLLPAYMNLARLLQPAMVVIEDVDLIAGDREDMGPCEETLLNRLLNEMDGLKEDADILFVLTTNRPEQLEAALAGRPGRVDQAIEVPLPDANGRAKLVRLYGRKLPLGDAVVDELVQRSEGVSAAFIKEMMRRLAQASLARDGGESLSSADIDEALGDMLLTGGRLNAKLLGGAQGMAAE